MGGGVPGEPVADRPGDGACEGARSSLVSGRLTPIVMEWTCVFDPDPGMGDEISNMTRGAYEAGIDALRQRFGS